jgi:hypothetical protein
MEYSMTMQQRSWILTTCCAAAVAVAALLGACGKREAREEATQAASESAKSDAELDSCRLLEPKQVEAVLGPLAGPPSRFLLRDFAPDANGNACVYEGADRRSIRIEAMTSGGASIMKLLGMPAGTAAQAGMKGVMPKGLLPEGASVAGEWDEAKVIGCCRINALLGDAMVTIDYEASRATPEQGVGLLNQALKQLVKPLAINGAAGVEPMKQRLAARAKEQRAPCALVTRGEAEAVLGALLQEPKASKDACEYHFNIPKRDGGTLASVAEIKVVGSGGYREFRDHLSMGRSVGKSMGLNGGDEISQLKGPWEEIGFAFPELMAVKRDVMVKVDTRLVPMEQAQALVARAMEKL